MWDLPGPGLEPVSPALAGGFFFFFFNRKETYIFFKINLFIYLYLFLAVLGLRFCARAFSSCDERGPLTVAASPVAEHRLAGGFLTTVPPGKSQSYCILFIYFLIFVLFGCTRS